MPMIDALIHCDVGGIWCLQVSDLEGKNSVLVRKLKEAKGEDVSLEGDADVTALNEKVKQLQAQAGKSAHRNYANVCRED